MVINMNQWQSDKNETKSVSSTKSVTKSLLGYRIHFFTLPWNGFNKVQGKNKYIMLSLFSIFATNVYFQMKRKEEYLYFFIGQYLKSSV